MVTFLLLKCWFTLDAAVWGFCNRLHRHRDRNFSISLQQCNCPLQNQRQCEWDLRPVRPVTNVYKSCPKRISLEKWNILTHLQKFPKNVVILGKIIVAIGIEKLPKVQKIAQSGHTALDSFRLDTMSYIEDSSDHDANLLWPVYALPHCIFTADCN